MITECFPKLAAFVCEGCKEIFLNAPDFDCCAKCEAVHIMCGACKFVHELSAAKQDHYLSKVIG